MHLICLLPFGNPTLIRHKLTTANGNIIGLEVKISKKIYYESVKIKRKEYKFGFVGVNMKLKEICEINPKTQGIDDSTEVSFVPMSSVTEDGKIDSYDIRNYLDVKKGYTVFQEGDVLFAKITPCMENGKGAIAYGLMNGKGCGSSEFYVLRPNKAVVTDEWIYYLTAWGGFRKEAEKHMTGSAGQKRVPKAYLENYVVNVPSIEEQKQQITVLVQLQQIIDNRKKELDCLDELIRARFVELFGDPIQNPKGWDTSLIENLVANEKNALKAGPFGSALKKEYYVESGYKIYGQEQVISGDHTIGNYYIDKERYKILENCAVQAGDVLISLVGTYGKLLIIPDEFEPGIINPRLMKITFDKNKVNPLYFKFFFQSESLKRVLSENTHGGTMDILNLGIVRKISMPLPPLKLQNKFFSFVEQVDKSKVAIQKSLDEVRVLLDSMNQKYFG